VRNLTRRIEMMAWSRKALRRKRARIAPAFIVIPGEHCAQRAQCEGREPNLPNRWLPRKLGPLPSTRADARASPGMTSEGMRGSPGMTGKTRGSPRRHEGSQPRNPWVSLAAGVTSPGRLPITQHG
jgi:hypothetical protein